MELTLSTELLMFSLLFLLLFAVGKDLAQNRIPNLLSLGILLLGCSIQILSEGFTGILTSLTGLLTGLALLLPLYLLGGMGAGDVKLMAALGTLLGPFNTLIAVAFTLILGAGLALLYVALHLLFQFDLNKLKTYLKNLKLTLQLFIYSRRLVPEHNDSDSIGKLRFPYALAISAGVVTVLIQQSLLSFVHLRALLMSELGISLGGAL
ncbi:MAG: prepilin peptidase [Amphritea sp.]|nr:prepilin peptidase [Amphritea sp.]